MSDVHDVGPSGIERILNPMLNESESTRFQASATAVRQQILKSS